MNITDLLERLNGEVLANKARAVVNGQVVVLARMGEAGWEYTAEGQELANLHSNQAAAEAEAKPARARKAKDAATEPVAVESADVAPEL